MKFKIITDSSANLRCIDADVAFQSVPLTIRVEDREFVDDENLDLEDMPMVLGIWSKSHLKRVWKERLVCQGKRMNILNYILAVKLFGVKHPDNYLARYAC